MAGRPGLDPDRRPGGGSAVRFRVLALTSATALGVFIIWAALNPGRGALASQVDDLCKLSVATLASASCFWLGRRAEPALRVAWMWVGASAFAWAIGEAIVTGYAFARNGAVPFPSGADIGFLAALPLSAIGVLLFPSAPQFGLPRARMLLDSAIVAGSLLIVSWATALGTLYYAGSGSVFSQAVGLAYPIGDVIVATVGISVLARGSGRKRIPLVLVVAGLLCLTVGDSSFEYLSHLGSFRYDTVVDAARIAAFLLIALALFWPLDTVSSGREEAKGPSPWQVALPYFFLAIAIIAAVVQHGQSGRSDRLVIVAGICVVVAVLTRQVLTLVENLRLAGQMQYAVTTLRVDQVELVHYAVHDPLTELPNRVLFGDRIEHALARRASPTRRVAVLLCDLDSFKDVNDTLGHSRATRCWSGPRSA